MNEFDFLVENGNVGIYNKCEIIEVLGFRKKLSPFNIFTLIVFEDNKKNNTKDFITKKLKKFKGFKDISWGIQKRTIDTDTVKKLYQNLTAKNVFEIGKDKLNIGKLNFIPKQYIMPKLESKENPQLNYILKNNFHNGSYIIEGFDEEKKDVKFLLDNPSLLNKFGEEVNDLIPIQIGNVSDRLGNIIFQFPINLFRVNHKSIILENPKRYGGVKISIHDIRDYSKKNLQLNLLDKNDNVIAFNKLIDIGNNKEISISMNDAFETSIEIIDVENSLILYRNIFHIIKSFNTSFNVVESQKRKFHINGKLIEVKVITSNNSKPKKKDFNDWINNRVYENTLKGLEEERSFIRYRGESGHAEKALSDIKSLINKHGKNGVYLWDPYLSAEDIKNTLYYCEYSNVKLKGITSLSQSKLEKNIKCPHCKKEIDKCPHCEREIKKKNKKEVFLDMKKEFELDDTKYLLMDLEVRAKTGSHGFNFHDRFLIFPLEKPKVWSLGISVNQLGKSHHIIQEVKHAQHILNDFNELWEELDEEECKIWKSM